ncbi:MAG TPA: hypothetical protein VF808_06270 [Ktedonobacterales bacterium]
MTDNELLATIFGGEESPLREACAAWIASSRLFRAFLEENAGKIRKKARQAGGGESLGDLRLEIDAAYRLLGDRRVTLIYERYLANKSRGPDFTVIYKGHMVFNIEVRRLRAPVAPGKASEVICEKLRQAPPGAVNVLLLGVDASPATASLDAAATVKRLVQRADAKQDDYFSERGYRDARDFLRALQRLSGVLARPGWNASAPGRPVLWLNPQAKHPVSAEIQKLLAR